MKSPVSYENRVAEAFGMDAAPTLVTRALRNTTMAVTELKCDEPNFGITAQMPSEDAWLVALQLRACPDHDLYFDGRMLRPTNWRRGVTAIYDLRRNPVADIRDPYHCLMFHLPRKALDAIADEACMARIDGLRYREGTATDDPVVRHLLSSLLPAIARPKDAPAIFLDHVALALTAHIAHTYGGMQAPPVRKGGLAPWQEQRVKELMSADLKNEVPLSRLALECNLSLRHFARAFRQSTGAPPHRWLLRHRVDCAKALLRKPGFSLTEIALECGFADQAHFTRVFTAMAGASPGAWRRAHGWAS